MKTKLKKIIEQLVEDAIEEVSSISAGGGSLQPSGQVSGTGGNPLGRDMSDQHKIMWSGDEPEDNNKQKKKKDKEINEAFDPEYYSEEACGVFAMVLHKVSGYPMYYLTDEGNLWDEENDIPSIVHVFAVLPNGKVVDSEGIKTVEDIKGRYYDLEAPAIRAISPEELAEYMGDSDVCPLYPLDKSDLDNAYEEILSNPQKYGLEDKKLDEACLDEEDLDEFSAVGTGAVAGYTLPLGMKPDYKTMGTKGKKKKRRKRWYDVHKEGQPKQTDVNDDLEEEYIGTRGGVRYYQMGSSLPDELYNKTDKGKPTRDPGVGGIYKDKKK